MLDRDRFDRISQAQPPRSRVQPMLDIFVGYDSREPEAWSVLAHSLLRRATVPVRISPLTRLSLGHTYTRPRGTTEATEFSLTRFLVPYLCNYEGFAVFMDCDMLCRVDIGDIMLHVLANPGKAVYCCQHNYVPKAAIKMEGQAQTAYPRKNWTSVTVWNCARCTMLTPEYVNQATGLELHRLQWLKDEQIGSLPLEWNWLVDEYPHNDAAKVLHYTNGGPWFDAYRDGDHAADWFAERDAMRGLTVPDRVTA